MKRKSKLLYLLSLIAGGALLLAACSNDKEQTAEPLRVMTFNIRLDTKADSLNWWGNRTDGINDFLQEQQPDLIGAQEVLKNQLDDLLGMLPNYSYIGVGRADGQEAGEYSPIFYNQERVELLEQGYFWLSETPDVPGSKGWDAACERIATWGVFKDLQNDSTFFMLNTHLDHVGDTARINSVTMIQEEISKWVDDYPVVVTGDFNLSPNTAPIQQMTNPQVKGHLSDSFLTTEVKEGSEWTYSGFGRRPIEKRNRIDYVFYNEGFKPIKYVTFSEPDTPDRIYLSDHTPIMVDFVRQ